MPTDNDGAHYIISLYAVCSVARSSAFAIKGTLKIAKMKVEAIISIGICLPCVLI